ncbi:LytR/AlgR family response regulator transcription factor [Clostridium gasigenes]|uniref:Stage 0 sporulation protein A homolog n=1 Tax=Clostridium gasigenes TaxID=94869 RepID=A0A7X0SDN1_9CLOT|nr:LytTR family DNA-binding domain-containing protein [Clostridium gasigenes]MBB6715708.1 response regulator transcription factor [Clostridium gasigenes]
MNCIILDDEIPAIRELSYFITTFSSIKILAEFDDSIVALEYMQINSVDVIFLDISMPKLNGLNFSKIINTLKSKPIIIFLSAYKQYAIEAFEIAAFDYVLKPYSECRIINTLTRLEKWTNINSSPYINNKITICNNEKMFVLNINDIYYCKSQEHDIFIHISNEEYKVSSSTKEFYKKLPQSIFFKCHRSYIVNLDKITEIIPWFNNTYMLKLQGLDVEIPVSRQNISQFKQLMGI